MLASNLCMFANITVRLILISILNPIHGLCKVWIENKKKINYVTLRDWNKLHSVYSTLSVTMTSIMPQWKVSFMLLVTILNRLWLTEIILKLSKYRTMLSNILRKWDDIYKFWNAYRFIICAVALFLDLEYLFMFFSVKRAIYVS